MATARFTRASGALPANARRAGYESDRQLQYVIRAEHDGGVHPGKYRQGWTHAAIGYGGKEVWVPVYEVWVGTLSDGSGGVWNPRSDAADAVPIGREADGSPLFAARAYHGGGLHLGKWKADWTAAAIPYGGGEVWLPQFQVLCPGQYIDGDDAFAWME